MDISPAAGKILGMLMAYAVSSLGLLLAYYNYRKRIVRAEQVFTPKARKVIVGVTVTAVIGMILGAAALQGDGGWNGLIDNLVGIVSTKRSFFSCFRAFVVNLSVVHR